MCGAVLAGQQGEEGVLQEHRDPISHWLPELCACQYGDYSLYLLDSWDKLFDIIKHELNPIIT